MLRKVGQDTLLQQTIIIRGIRGPSSPFPSRQFRTGVCLEAKDLSSNASFLHRRPFYTCSIRKSWRDHLPKIPEASNEPLAGTFDESGPPWFFIMKICLAAPVILWTYKCMMMVLFQRMIYYMPYIPPGARRQSLKEFVDDGLPSRTKLGWSRDVHYEQIMIPSSGLTRWMRRKISLSTLVTSSCHAQHEVRAGPNEKDLVQDAEIIILYLQGNAGGPLHRMPIFSSLLPSSSSNYRREETTQPPKIAIQIYAPAPRSYWQSTKTALTEEGILEDYRSVLTYIREKHASRPTVSGECKPVKLFVYGHSLGGAAALLLTLQDQGHNFEPDKALPISGLILENPMPSIPTMVKGMYPQKYLPYHYLGPLAFDRWDSIRSMLSLSKIISSDDVKSPGSELPPTLWLVSERDEIIERKGVEEMYDTWVSMRREKINAFGSKAKAVDSWSIIPSALHDTAYQQNTWKIQVSKFLEAVHNAK